MKSINNSVWVMTLLLMLLISKSIHSQNDIPKLNYSGDGLYYALTEASEKYNFYAVIYFFKNAMDQENLTWFHLAIPKQDEIERVIYLAMTEEGLKNLSGKKYSGSYKFIDENGTTKVRVDANKMIDGGLFGDDSFVARTFILKVENNSNRLIGKYLAKSWDHFPLTNSESKERNDLTDFIDAGEIEFIFLED